jgi:DNA-binding beta-propeller fold protein YncE
VLKKVLAPGGRSGNLDLVDPGTLAVTAIGGFSTSTTFMLGSHASGTTSADEGSGALFAIDHETQSVRVVDPKAEAIVSSTMLAGAPDYVRWVESSSEIWVTEPGTGIEVLTVPPGGAPVHAATIPVSNGPEAIVVDNARHRVYTNSFLGSTYAVDIAQRTIVGTWTNGCSPLSLGIALDEVRGFVFVACSGGKVVVLDVANGGSKLGELAHGSGFDIISYSASLHHLYLPGGTSADLAIVGISPAGTPTLLGSAPTAKGSQEVTSDDRGNAWVADQANGRLLKVVDPYPATP